MCDSMVTYNELCVQPFQCLDTNMAAQQAQLYLVLRWYNESLIFNSQAILFLDEDAEKGGKKKIQDWENLTTVMECHS